MELFIKNEMEKNQVILYINNNVMEDIFIQMLQPLPASF